VISCEDKKAEIKVRNKTFILSKADNLTISRNSYFSIINKSNNKDFEISCKLIKDF
jgi:hypothetical protein